jgi:hypothetical protein
MQDGMNDDRMMKEPSVPVLRTTPLITTLPLMTAHLTSPPSWAAPAPPCPQSEPW